MSARPLHTVKPAGRSRVLVIVLRLVTIVSMTSILASVFQNNLSSHDIQIASSQATLTAEHVAVTDDGSHAAVSLRITAASRALDHVEVWWLLALPAEEHPWEAPMYMSSHKWIDHIAPGGSVDVTWRDAQPTIPRGTYAVSAWVHEEVAPGESRHVVGGTIAQVTVSQPLATSVHLDGDRFPEPTGPLVLQSLSVVQPSPLARTLTVEASVSNRSQAPHDGRIYWLIDRISAPQPWVAPDWKTPWLRIANLPSGGSESVHWTTQIDLPPDTYAVSVWIQTREGDSWKPSHNSVLVPVELGRNPTNIQRAGPITSPVFIQQARPAGQNRATLFVENSSNQERDISLRLTGLPERRRYDWYREPMGEGPASGEYRIPPQQTVIVPVTLPIACAGERRLVRVDLLDPRRQPSLRPLDDVLLGGCS